LSTASAASGCRPSWAELDFDDGTRRGPVPRKTSSRLITILTGAGLARHPKAKVRGRSGLAAKAAAISAGIARICEMSMPASFAQ